MFIIYGNDVIAKVKCKSLLYADDATLDASSANLDIFRDDSETLLTVSKD